MPKMEPEMASTARVTERRLPHFGAEASVGPPSRAYRSPLSVGATGASSVAPSYLDETQGSDVDDTGESDSDDSDDGGSGDDDAGESIDSQSET